jgi:hypothetical protein
MFKIDYVCFIFCAVSHIRFSFVPRKHKVLYIDITTKQNGLHVTLQTYIQWLFGSNLDRDIGKPEVFRFSP